ncbi:MAG: hypothetical protein V7631_56 [Massilia sp.]|jgi:hypothetical protein
MLRSGRRAARHARLHRHGAQVAEGALAGCGEEERRQLLALLERVQANLDAAPGR